MDKKQFIKETYEAPEMETVEFLTTDVIQPVR